MLFASFGPISLQTPRNGSKLFLTIMGRLWKPIGLWSFAGSFQHRHDRAASVLRLVMRRRVCENRRQLLGLMTCGTPYPSRASRTTGTSITPKQCTRLIRSTRPCPPSDIKASARVPVPSPDTWQRFQFRRGDVRLRLECRNPPGQQLATVLKCDGLAELLELFVRSGDQAQWRRF